MLCVVMMRAIWKAMAKIQWERMPVATRKMATMNMVCDRFHFANHTDKWCKKKCNRYKTANLGNQRK